MSAERLTGTATLEIIENIAPLDVWATIFALIAIFALAGLARPRMAGLRAIAAVSVFVEVVFGLGLLFAGTTSPGAVMFLAAAATDVVVASMPSP